MNSCNTSANYRSHQCTYYRSPQPLALGVFQIIVAQRHPVRFRHHLHNLTLLRSCGSLELLPRGQNGGHPMSRSPKTRRTTSPFFIPIAS